MAHAGVSEIVSVLPSTEAVPRFMRRRMALLTEIGLLVDELDATLDRVERATELSSQASERGR